MLASASPPPIFGSLGSSKPSYLQVPGGWSRADGHGFRLPLQTSRRKNNLCDWLTGLNEVPVCGRAGLTGFPHD